MIEQIRLRGVAGSVLWGYRPVAELARWAIIRDDHKKLAHVRRERAKAGEPGRKKTTGSKLPPGFLLQAAIIRGDSFQLRQKPLYFTAVRRGGYWFFPILEPPTVDSSGILRAKLGPPER